MRDVGDGGGRKDVGGLMVKEDKTERNRVVLVDGTKTERRGDGMTESKIGGKGRARKRSQKRATAERRKSD